MARYYVRPLVALAALAVAFGVCPATGRAAQLIARNATNIHLAANGAGQAVVSYTSGGQIHRVLAAAAINALPPSRTTPQVSFRLTYGGGAGVGGVCGRYDGPALFAVVAACKAPDGSYWALQSWQEALPDLGFAPWTPEQSEFRLELSHWRGPLPQLDLWQAWAQSADDAIFGVYTYDGNPVYGFGTTKYGIPTDDYGRLVYLDTYNSKYGSGWRRENSFVSHRPNGEFCYALIARNPRVGGYEYPPGLPLGSMRGPATGTRYRVVAEGPGVTPLVSWEGAAVGAYDANDPADVALAGRTRLRFASIGSSCSAGQGWIGAATNMTKVLQAFAQPGSQLWNPPIVSGGATVTSTSSGGISFHLPSGQATAASLIGSRSWWGPQFYDLGSTGVPSGATLELYLDQLNGHPTDPAQPYPGPYFGIRIGDGSIQVVRRQSTWAGSGKNGAWQSGSETVEAQLPYNPKTMRWLYLRLRNDYKHVEINYATSVEGPWHRWGTYLSGDITSSTDVLALSAQGDGSAATVIAIASLSR